MALGVSLFASCTKKEEAAPISITAAQKKFETKCREEFELQVITRMVGQTLYIYLPIDKPIFDYEAQKENNQSMAEDPAKQKFSVQFLDVNLTAGKFNIEYDIIDKKKSSKEDYGYNSAYTESYSKTQNNLFTAITDTFFSAKPDPKEQEPRFVVIIVTDIKKGIETRSTFYLEDFKRYMSGDLPYDEYMKRFLADTKGGQSFIGDEIGSHIDYKDITMGEFLSTQLTNRIQFKFQRSDFPPNPDFDDAIIAIVADTTRYYQFNEFAEIRLNNLRLNKKFIFTKEQLAAFGDDKPQDKKASQGKLIHIVFENGKVQIPDEESKP